MVSDMSPLNNEYDKIHCQTIKHHRLNILTLVLKPYTEYTIVNYKHDFWLSKHDAVPVIDSL